MRSPRTFGNRLKGFMAKAATTDDVGNKAGFVNVVNEPAEEAPLAAISESQRSNAKPQTVANTTAMKSPSKTNADQVLTEIMKDLKIGELAVHEMKSDEVSEFDGQSAQVLEGDTSEESEDDQVARRVDAVVAAAEEIRKKKNAEKSASRSIGRKKKKENNAPEGRDEEEDVVTSGTDKQDEAEVAAQAHPSTKSVKSRASRREVKTSDKIMVTTDEEIRKECSESLSTFGSTEDETLDENHSHTDTECEDTIATKKTEEEETRTIRTSRTNRTNRTKGKNTIMNKDVIIHAPGGPENLVVRKMYYTPVPNEPEEVIIQVEVSVLLLFLLFYYKCLRDQNVSSSLY